MISLSNYFMTGELLTDAIRILFAVLIISYAVNFILHRIKKIRKDD